MPRKTKILLEKDLTTRDREIIGYVRQYRLMKSRDHILPLFDNQKRVLERLRLLSEGKYLFQLPHREKAEQAVFALGDKGADLLSDTYARPKSNLASQHRTLKLLTKEHRLLITEIMVRIEVACRENPFVRFISPKEIFDSAPGATRSRWYGLNKSSQDDRFEVSASVAGQPSTIYGDWLFGIELLDRKKKVYFFVEADRGSMDVISGDPKKPSIVKKLLVYTSAGQVAQKAILRERGIGTISVFEESYRIKKIRTLFIIDPDSARGTTGALRVQTCLKRGKEISKSGLGSNQFLFTDNSFLISADVLTAPIFTGKGEETHLIK